MDLQRHGQVEKLLGAFVVIAAMMIAMPQFTTFALATAYVLSGPILMARGERSARSTPQNRSAAADKIGSAVDAVNLVSSSGHAEEKAEGLTRKPLAD
jgi:hypothetical protein